MAANTTGMYVVFDLNGKPVVGPSKTLQNAFEVHNWDFSVFHPAHASSSGNSKSSGIMQVSGIPCTCEFSIEIVNLINANKTKDHMKATFTHAIQLGKNQVKKELELVLDEIFIQNMSFGFRTDGNGGRIQMANFYIDQITHKGKFTTFKEEMGADGKNSPAMEFDWEYAKL